MLGTNLHNIHYNWHWPEFCSMPYNSVMWMWRRHYIYCCQSKVVSCRVWGCPQIGWFWPWQAASIHPISKWTTQAGWRQCVPRQERWGSSMLQGRPPLQLTYKRVESSMATFLQLPCTLQRWSFMTTSHKYNIMYLYVHVALKQKKIHHCLKKSINDFTRPKTCFR